eukprot:GHVU01068007.1.p1 GENE.GHVU01068007.1~~GHVU01068007.1.p1  ORF type:complete len:531 (-),score=47.00 GHVU01068007.1:2438-3886(-)
MWLALQLRDTGYLFSGRLTNFTHSGGRVVTKQQVTKNAANMEVADTLSMFPLTFTNPRLEKTYKAILNNQYHFRAVVLWIFCLTYLVILTTAMLLSTLSLSQGVLEYAAIPFIIVAVMTFVSELWSLLTPFIPRTRQDMEAWTLVGIALLNVVTCAWSIYCTVAAKTDGPGETAQTALYKAKIITDPVCVTYYILGLLIPSLLFPCRFKVLIWFCLSMAITALINKAVQITAFALVGVYDVIPQITLGMLFIITAALFALTGRWAFEYEHRMSMIKLIIAGRRARQLEQDMKTKKESSGGSTAIEDLISLTKESETAVQIAKSKGHGADVSVELDQLEDILKNIRKILTDSDNLYSVNFAESATGEQNQVQQQFIEMYGPKRNKKKGSMAGEGVSVSQLPMASIRAPPRDGNAFQIGGSPVAGAGGGAGGGYLTLKDKLILPVMVRSYVHVCCTRMYVRKCICTRQYALRSDRVSSSGFIIN